MVAYGVGLTLAQEQHVLLEGLKQEREARRLQSLGKFAH